MYLWLQKVVIWIKTSVCCVFTVLSTMIQIYAISAKLWISWFLHFAGAPEVQKMKCVCFQFLRSYLLPKLAIHFFFSAAFIYIYKLTCFWKQMLFRWLDVENLVYILSAVWVVCLKNIYFLLLFVVFFLKFFSLSCHFHFCET